ncbi:M28 family peptidase [Bacteroides sp. OttesenSCG-928-J23]|nr:M28 family peptidase [Bacteroides sp. OttesenSCG-928-N06]MDL2247498.1 M28 family peptidase [Bacteroides sp. OttesenSCG-928-J23]MDL2304506.1 M28 family peptidase [Bacteroides sp. OttesenSCG-928-D19]
MKNYIMLLLIGCLLLLTESCKTNTVSKADESETRVTAPSFSADSAYLYIQEQVNFGPRVPNTKAHIECGEYLAQKLEEFGATVTSQYTDLIAYNGTMLKSRNIIGTYNPESKKRIALFAHWDTRPWADNDPDKKNHYSPVLGANDGASGVGVLLEIARLINKEAPTIGVDIIFFDAEDYGEHRQEGGTSKEEFWALGSQYWARYPHTEGYNARFGILLDMVGGKNATFYREGYSEQYAPGINKKVWNTAKTLGYSKFFIDERTTAVTDDHTFVNRIARIPTIDIVPNMVNAKRSSFGDTWHTVHDNMDNISKETLQAVGQTVVSVIYNEK